MCATRCLCHRDGFGRALVWMHAAEEQQGVAAVRIEGEVVEDDPVVDRLGVCELRRSVGIADRDIMHPILIRLVHRQDAIGRKTVDRRDHRRRHEVGEGMGGEIGLVVDQVEFARAFEDMGEVAVFPNLCVDRRVFGIGRGDDAGEGAGGQAVLRREQRDVDAACDQRLGEQAGDQFPRAIMAGRGAPGDRGEHRDFHGWRSPETEECMGVRGRNDKARW